MAHESQWSPAKCSSEPSAQAQVGQEPMAAVIFGCGPIKLYLSFQAYEDLKQDQNLQLTKEVSWPYYQVVFTN